jgi:hypothetical protein
VAGLYVLAGPLEARTTTLEARSLGLPAVNLGGGFWQVLFIGEFVVICIHEGGHASAAWAVGFRFQSICIGPLITRRDAATRSLRALKFVYGRAARRCHSREPPGRGSPLCGRLDEATSLAQHARDLLLASKHPNAASALITVAVIRREPEVVNEALRIIIEDPLLKPGPKARWLERQAEGLEHFGWLEKAAQYREAAAAVHEAVTEEPVAIE